MADNKKKEEDKDKEFAYSAPSLKVKNKIQRKQLNNEIRHIKRIEKRKRREKRKREREELGEDAPPPKQQRTLESVREKDETIVQPDDTEVVQDEAVDEFADYFSNKTTPKILITTSSYTTRKEKKRAYAAKNFAKDLVAMIPNSVYKRRKTYALKDIIVWCKERNFTDVIVINDDKKKPNSLLLTHLPNGPTALFKLTSVVLARDIYERAQTSDHRPEVILNNFNTRLGHTIGRMFAALVPQAPEFKGRRVMTFHNQRDFIFFRHHRYIFDSEEKARLQEIGPRFTLKLKSLQHGTFDTKFGEYEWVQKAEMVTSRRRFFL